MTEAGAADSEADSEAGSIAVVFPGQGVQRPGLGSHWRHLPAWSVVERAEEAVGRPLRDLLLDDARLARTEDAQMAVLLASLLAWEAAGGELGQPTFFAGHSLGQLTALVASGALSVEDGVRLTAARAAATQAASERTPGRLAALLGCDLPLAERVCAAAADECWVANDNAPGQVVIGGTVRGVERATEAAREMGVRKVVPVDVAGAFHTPLMSRAAEEFRPWLQATAFGEPSSPVVSNGDARPHGGHGWPSRLAEHLVSRVRWRESVQAMVAAGVSQIVEVGPGGVLSGRARRIVPHVHVRSIAAPDDLAEKGRP